MIKNNVNITQFKIFYIGGIILGFILGILIVLLKFPSWLLLIEGIIHLIRLVYLGYKIKIPSDRMYAGERIQTAGYLHTLIGFSFALILLGTGNIELSQLDNLQQLLLPMGSALGTSIIGWLFGGEIAGGKAIQDLGNIADLLDEQNQTLNSQSHNFKETEQRQINLLIEHQKQMVALYIQNNQVLDEKINKIVDKIGEYNQSISEIFSRFNSTLENECDTLNSTFRRLNTALEEESTSLKQTFSHLNSVIDDESYALPPSFNKLRSVIEQNSDSLSTSFVSLNNAFTNLQTESGEAAKYMSTTVEYTRSAANNMSVTAQGAYEAADYLKKTHVLIQQLESLLKYITEEKMRRSA